MPRQRHQAAPGTTWWGCPRCGAGYASNKWYGGRCGDLSRGQVKPCQGILIPVAPETGRLTSQAAPGTTIDLDLTMSALLAACPICHGANTEYLYDHSGPGRHGDEVVKPCTYCKWVRAFLDRVGLAP